MRRIFILIGILAVLILGCGCLQNPGHNQETPAITGNEKALQVIRGFMNDTGYNPPMNNLSLQNGLLVINSGNTSFTVDISREKVVRAAFSGPDAMEEVAGTPHYDRAIEGIRAFLQYPGFEYPFTEFTYEMDRYGLSAVNISFRVNATSGNVTSARLQGPDLMSALQNSTSYQDAREAAED
ncbi:MAG: hypothetical protein LUQ01_00640 [Methanolinea sp.]|nr:hypothetical protein [Methanolinea sp.]